MKFSFFAFSFLLVVVLFSLTQSAPVLDKTKKDSKVVEAAEKTKFENAPSQNLKRKQFGDLPNPSDLTDVFPLPFNEGFPVGQDAIDYFESSCSSCTNIIDVILSATEVLDSPDFLQIPFKAICSAYLVFNGFDDSSEICQGLFDLYVPAIFTSVKNTSLDTAGICHRFNYCVNYMSTDPSSRRRRSEALTQKYGARIQEAAKARNVAAQTEIFQQMLQDSIQQFVRESRHDKESLNYKIQPLYFDENAHVNPNSISSITDLFKEKPLLDSLNEVKAKARQVKTKFQNAFHRHSSRLSSSRRQITNNSTNSGVVRILQLTDIHLDPYYAPGSEDECGTFLCCRASYGPGNAGQFGDYQCDLPLVTLQGLFSYVQTNFINSSSNLNIDYAIWTGDNPAHDIWNTTLASTQLSTTMIKDLFLQYLPNTKVLPTFGNHDGFPHNLYYQPTDSNVVDFLATTWSQWLSNDSLALVRQAGYYSELIGPGLRVLSLNTQFGYSLNFYVLLNEQVPAAENQWNYTRTILQQARQNNEKVIIVGHIPPGGTDAIPTYGSVYSTIISEYSDVVVLQVFGHTHFDQFIVVHSVGSPQSINPVGYPAGVAFIAPSVTPYVNINPSFRIYTLNSTTFEFIDYENYYFNLTLANLMAANVSFPTPEYLSSVASTVWTKLYSLRDAYNITLTSSPSLPSSPSSPSSPSLSPSPSSSPSSSPNSTEPNNNSTTSNNNTAIVAPTIAVALNELSIRLLNDTALASKYVTLQFAASAPRECTIESGCTKAAFCFTSCSTVTRYASCLGGFFDPRNVTTTPPSNSSSSISSSISTGVTPSSATPAPSPVSFVSSTANEKPSLKDGVLKRNSKQGRRFANLRNVLNAKAKLGGVGQEGNEKVKSKKDVSSTGNGNKSGNAKTRTKYYIPLNYFKSKC